MVVSSQIQYASVDDLYLDPQNPRLGRHNTEKNLQQDAILKEMEGWTLDELAVSYLESGGFWVQEALIVVQDEMSHALIVVEGNRRLAALKFLKRAADGQDVSPKWRNLIKQYEIPAGLFDRVPYLRADTRQDVQAFLGFRHVTGIKQWAPAEKAEYIAKFLDQGMSYEQVAKRIGSKIPTTRQHYIAFRLLQQLENQIEEFDPNLKTVQRRFSVLYLSLRTAGVQSYLQLDIEAKPEPGFFPVPHDNIAHLSKFSVWMFGTEKIPPLFTDSRQVDKFSDILLSSEALEYLEKSPDPRFDIAYQIAGGDVAELVQDLRNASSLVQFSLTEVHLHKSNDQVKETVRTLGQHFMQLLTAFPGIKQDLMGD